MEIYQINDGVDVFLRVEYECDNNYEIKMIENNKYNYLLETEITRVDTKNIINYRTKRYVPLNDIFEKQTPTFAGVKELMNGICMMIEELEQYLLSVKSVCFDIRYIYVDSDSGRYYFTYMPGWEFDFRQQMKELFEIIMAKFDSTDKEGQVYLYELYRDILNNQITYRSIIESSILKNNHGKSNNLVHQINTASNEQVESFIDGNKINYNSSSDKLNNNIANSNKKDNSPPKGNIKGKKKVNRAIIMCIGAVLLSILLYAILGFKSYPFVCIIVVVCIISVVEQIVREREENEMDEAMKAVIVNDDIDQIIESYDNSNLISKLVSLDDINQAIELRKDITLVGRSKVEADYPINKKEISRIHATIFKKDGQTYIRDNDSTNGTFVNAKRVCKGMDVQIVEGDVVTFAKYDYSCR